MIVDANISWLNIKIKVIIKLVYIYDDFIKQTNWTIHIKK